MAARLNQRVWLKIEEGRDGKPIARHNGKVVLFRGDSWPPVGRVALCVLEWDEGNYITATCTGALKPRS